MLSCLFRTFPLVRFGEGTFAQLLKGLTPLVRWAK